MQVKNKSEEGLVDKVYNYLKTSIPEYQIVETKEDENPSSPDKS